MEWKVVVLPLFLLAFAVCFTEAQTLPGSDLFVAEKYQQNNQPTPQTQWNSLSLPSNMCVHVHWKISRIYQVLQGQYYMAQQQPSNVKSTYDIIPCPL